MLSISMSDMPVMTIYNVLLQFEAALEQKQNEIDELSERLQQQHKNHQQSVTILENECQLKVDEVQYTVCEIVRK